MAQPSDGAMRVEWPAERPMSVSTLIDETGLNQANLSKHALDGLHEPLGHGDVPHEIAEREGAFLVAPLHPIRRDAGGHATRGGLAPRAAAGRPSARAASSRAKASDTSAPSSVAGTSTLIAKRSSCAR